MDYKKGVEEIIEELIETHKESAAVNQLLALIEKAQEDLIEKIEKEADEYRVTPGYMDFEAFIEYLDSLKGEKESK